MSPLNTKLAVLLKQREQQGLLRNLTPPSKLIDFCSNDYLSFACCKSYNLSASLLSVADNNFSGSTGSRLISGNSALAEQLEAEIAEYHNAPAGLLFNSGYDANLGLFQCIAQRGDTILYDQFCHASIIDGIRLSYASGFKFRHNNLVQLEQQLLKATGNVFVAVESVYSMDGDSAPLRELVTLCERYNANLIVDEAHATGVFGNKGVGLVVNNGVEFGVFARVHTFGKALGCHGAIVLGSDLLRNYLINFARSFIYTTALPTESLKAIRAAYHALSLSANQQAHLHQLINYFKQELGNGCYCAIPSNSAIQSIVVAGNETAKEAAIAIRKEGFDVRAILSPTVPKGKERLRICLHVHNTFSEIDDLIKAIKKAIVVV